jgi:hypothetical protein
MLGSVGLGGGNSGSNVGRNVYNQFIFSTGTVSLGSNLLPQTTQLIPNYNNTAMSSFKIALTVTDTTGGSTAPSGVQPIESVIQQIRVQTNDGIDLINASGAYLDLSATARYLTPGGLYYPSPTPADTSTSTPYAVTWNLVFPFSVDASKFPLKCFVTYNTLGSRATTLNSMTSTVNLSFYANYTPHTFTAAKIKNISIPVAATGTIPLSTYYDIGSKYLLQAYQYGTLSTSSSSSDNAIGTTGSGITFTPDGSLSTSSAPLQTFVDKENIAYPNSISTGIGHIYGMINLFSDPFVATAASTHPINFASAPSVYGASNQVRTICVEAIYSSPK